MEIELPNGQIAEFPDNMPHEQIESVLQKQFTSPKRGTATGAFLRSAIRTPLEGAENFADMLGLHTNKNAQWPEWLRESESDKSHPFAEIGGGLAGMLVPGSPVRSGLTALRSIPAWGNIVQKSAPSLLRRLPVGATEGGILGASLSPEGHRKEGAMTGAGFGIAGASAPSIAKSFGSLKQRISSLRNLDKLRQEGKISEEEYLSAMNNEKALEELSKSQGLKGNVEKLEADLPEIKKEAENIQQNIKNIPEVNTSNMLPAPTGEELIPNAESTLKLHKAQSENIGRSLGEHLYRGFAHDVPIAEETVNTIEGVPIKGSYKRLGGVKKEIGQIFKSIEKNLEDQNIVVPRTENLIEIENQARKTLENSRHFFRNDAEYEKTVKQAVEKMTPQSKGNDIIPAQNVLSNYTSLRHLSQKMRKKAFSRDVAGNKDLQKDMLSKADEMEGQATSLEQLLESHDLGDQLENLKAANKRWREEVVPLYKNKTYLHFLNGYGPSDIIHSLRGKGPGQEIIKNIIKKNPVLTRATLGQRHAKNPETIHDFDQLSQEFIDSAPQETRDLIAQHKQTLENITRSEQRLENAKTQAKEVQSEANRVNESFNEQKNKQKERQENIKQLTVLQEKIKNIERNIPAMKKNAQAKNISLEKKLAKEAEIKKAEQDIKTLKSQAIKYTVGLSALVLSGLGLSSFNNRLK